jgi:hypothetical protein
MDRVQPEPILIACPDFAVELDWRVASERIERLHDFWTAKKTWPVIGWFGSVDARS